MKEDVEEDTGTQNQECRGEAVQGVIVHCLIQHNTAMIRQPAVSSWGTHLRHLGQKYFTLGLK